MSSYTLLAHSLHFGVVGRMSLSREDARPPVPRAKLPIGAALSTLTKFDGRNLPLKEWKAQLETTIQLYDLPADVQVDLALKVLTGDAWETIQGRPQKDRRTLEDVFTVLKKVYGEKSTCTTLRKRLFARTQREDETLAQYANALQGYLKELQEQHDEGFLVGNSDAALRDLFVAGLRNRPLRHALQDKVDGDPDLTFFDVLDRALVKEENGEYSACAVETQPTKSTVAATAPEANPLETYVKELTGALLLVKEEVSQLRQRVEEFESGSAESRKRNPDAEVWNDARRGRDDQYTPRKRGEGYRHRGAIDLACWECGKPGHFARECPDAPRTRGGRRRPLN